MPGFSQWGVYESLVDTDMQGWDSALIKELLCPTVWVWFLALLLSRCINSDKLFHLSKLSPSAVIELLKTECLCPSKIQVLKHNPNVMVLARSLCHKGRAFVIGISALTKEAPESSLGPSITWVHSKKPAIYEPETMPLPDTESAGTMILDFPDQKREKKISAIYKPHSLKDKYLPHRIIIRIKKG